MSASNIWSDEEPIYPGWYWMRNKENKYATILFISHPEYVIKGYQWVKIEEPKEPKGEA